jgi:hypothetical protein
MILSKFLPLRAVLAVNFLLATSFTRAADPELAIHQSMMEATIKIFHETSTATGFLIKATGPDDGAEQVFVVTAAHVFRETKSDFCTLVLRKKGFKESWTRLDHKVPIRENNKTLWREPKDRDVAILPVTLHQDHDGDPIDIELMAGLTDGIAARPSPGLPLFLMGYPARLESHPAGFCIMRSGRVAGMPKATWRELTDFMMDVETHKGDSGGPIYRIIPPDDEEEKPTFLIVGIASAMYREDETMRGVHEERTVHHPLGLSKVIPSHWAKSLIKDFLEEPPKKTDPEEKPEEEQEE